MQFPKKLISVLLSLTLLISSNLPTFAVSISGGTGQSPVNLTMEETNFDITVPVSLPISVSADGIVTVANDAKIINNSYGPIVVDNLKLTASSGWQLANYNDDYKSKKVNSKDLGFKINNEEVQTDGTVTMTETDWPSIAGHGNLPITYNGKLSARSTPISGVQAATAEFLFDWDDGSVRFQQSDVTLGKTSTYQLNTLGTGIAATPITAISSILSVIAPVFKSNDTNIATIDQAGKITAVSPGSTTVTATLNNKTAKCNVTVLDLTVSNTDGGNTSLNYNRIDNNITFAAIPKTGYKFIGWVDTNDNIISADMLYKCNMNTDLNLKAKFIERTAVSKQYTITLTASNNGTVTGSGLYDEGSVATLTAKGNTGYGFVKWSDGNTNATRIITVNNDLSLTATFEICKTQTNYLYNGIYYNLSSNGTATVSSGTTTTGISLNTSLSGKIVIPETIVDTNGTSYKVISIGDYAFRDCKGITSIIIPDSITSINKYAFFNCIELINIVIPNSINSIGSSAFASCTGLTNIIIPNSVTSIGSGAFTNCSLPDNQALVYARNADGSENKTVLISYGGANKNVIIPNSVVSIGTAAFNGCTELTNVTIPNSVTSIGNSAFDNCTILTSVMIPSSVTSIGRGAFAYCSDLTNITIPNSVTSIGDGAFAYCYSLTNITIPNSVTSIGISAFSGCNFPDSQAFIYARNADGSENKTSLIGYGGANKNPIMPNSVTSIGKYTFINCTGLTSVTIPNSVISIESSAFSGWTNTQTIKLQGRTDTTGMTLGTGWSSSATVAYS
jgi:hypothetical protein